MTALRNLMIPLLIVFPLLTNGQSRSIDTIFLLKEYKKGIYHSIFIDTSKSSKFYDQIINYNFGPFDQESYDNSLHYLQENKIELAKKTITGIPLKWVALEVYKGKFYTYKPSDFLTHFQINITDTAFIDYTGEGPVANKINSFKKLDRRNFQFNLTGIYAPQRCITIHIIDIRNDIAVFEETSKDQSPYYYLMISASKIRNFPIIVNFCETQKQLEFKFEEPNFADLLKIIE